MLTTARGQVSRQGHAIIAGKRVCCPYIPAAGEPRVMPINSFIARRRPAARPLGGRSWTDDICVADFPKFRGEFIIRFSPERRFLLRRSAKLLHGLSRRIIRTRCRPDGNACFRNEWVWANSACLGRAAALGIHHPPPAAFGGPWPPNILSGSGSSGHGVALSGMCRPRHGRAVWYRNGLEPASRPFASRSASPGGHRASVRRS